MPTCLVLGRELDLGSAGEHRTHRPRRGRERSCRRGLHRADGVLPDTPNVAPPPRCSDQFCNPDHRLRTPAQPARMPSTAGSRRCALLSVVRRRSLAKGGSPREVARNHGVFADIECCTLLHLPPLLARSKPGAGIFGPSTARLASSERTELSNPLPPELPSEQDQTPPIGGVGAAAVESSLRSGGYRLTVGSTQRMSPRPV